MAGPDFQNTGELCQTLKKGIIPFRKWLPFRIIPFRALLENIGGRNISQLILWYQNQTETLQKLKFQTNSPREHRHKNPNRMLLNQTQYYIKRITYHNHVGFISRTQTALTFENQWM